MCALLPSLSRFRDRPFFSNNYTHSVSVLPLGLIFIQGIDILCSILCFKKQEEEEEEALIKNMVWLGFD